jgi:hypothetical protein
MSAATVTPRLNFAIRGCGDSHNETHLMQRNGFDTTKSWKVSEASETEKIIFYVIKILL